MMFYSPLQKAPQTSQWRRTFLPSVSSRRLPQSVQKTREPMAAILNGAEDVTYYSVLTIELGWLVAVQISKCGGFGRLRYRLCKLAVQST